MPGEPDQVENKQLLRMLLLGTDAGEPPSTGNLDGTGATSENLLRTLLLSHIPQIPSTEEGAGLPITLLPAVQSSASASACPKGCLQAEFIFSGARLVILSLRSHTFKSDSHTYLDAYDF